ncbi:leukocyte elastase inhibitor-like [Centropristis striata]|uniref:leukocyte elastase inhibitor-like n=1 Tax=Centropristis striata TaxID=184440 RepID=UPI0027DF644B|nr:leukocyte elastase inhibitor-like [Centropristis striata]
METSSSSKISKANTSFCLAFLKKLSDEDKTGNIFFSPFSISAALAMVMLGTKGNTHTQISEVLRFSESEQPNEPEDPQTLKPSPMQSQMQTRMQMRSQIRQTSRVPEYLRKCLKPENDPDDIHANFGQLLSLLIKEDAPYALSLANRLYGEQSYTFVEHFLAETKKHYNAALEPVDFLANLEAARLNINGWVEQQTQDKIKNLLGPDALVASTKLVLVNAIYFKGKWDEQFKEDDTADAQFRINKSDTKPVKMMRQKTKFHFTGIPEANCKILELPYQGKDLSMIIILPVEIEDDTTGLEKLEKELTHDKFTEWTDRMLQVEVEVRLPRFKLEETYDLKDILISMGMVDAFDHTKSDFSGMSPANDLVLSKVVHKAYVDVNEEGTEAAAATAAVIIERTAFITENFIADHPFLFFIQHKPTKTILFAGKYCSPE